MQKLRHQEALHQIVVITQTIITKKDNTKSEKINNLTAGEIMMKKHNENHSKYKRNRFRNKHKLNSPKIKIIDRSLLPKKKKTLVNRNMTYFVMQSIITARARNAKQITIKI